MLVEKPRAVITGAGAGFGRALALEIGRRGGSVLVSDNRLAAAEETVALLKNAGVTAYAVSCDVAKAEEVERLAVDAERLLGGVDLVINNAGVAVEGMVGTVPLSDWHWLMNINLWGVVYGCHVFAPLLQKQGRGHIINIASAAGLLCMPSMAPYNVAKAGVVALSETLGAELKPHGVGVTVVCPTFFKTELTDRTRSADPKLVGRLQKLMAHGKLTADQIAVMTLDAAAHDDLYVVPQEDGRWLWRLKRLAPDRFHALVPKVFALVQRRM